MTEKLMINPDRATDLYNSADGEKVGPFTRKGVQHVRTSRWSEHYWLVFTDEDGGTWGLAYQEGLTENQEGHYPWEETAEPLPLVRLYAHEVTRVEYRTEAPA